MLGPIKGVTSAESPLPFDKMAINLVNCIEDTDEDSAIIPREGAL